ncbi:MAG: hypothetical protein LBV06_02795 [Propionibacteriaceae bacterium]|nr:hypothetical protein [Propionibacteriaceae bacterium]
MSAPADTPPTTGDVRLDEALRAVTRLNDVPLSEAAAIVTTAQQRLQSFMDRGSGDRDADPS